MKLLRKIRLEILAWSTRLGLHPKLPKPKRIERPFVWRPRIRGEALSSGELLVEFPDAGCEFVIKPLNHCTKGVKLLPDLKIYGTPDELDKILDPSGRKFEVEKREQDGERRWVITHIDDGEKK